MVVRQGHGDITDPALFAAAGADAQVIAPFHNFASQEALVRFCLRNTCTFQPPNMAFQHAFFQNGRGKLPSRVTG